MENRYKLQIYPKAQSDLNNIFEYISAVLSNKQAANDLAAAFEDAFERICDFPEICPVLDNKYLKYKGLRKLLVENYIVFYRLKGNLIQIIRIMYSMQNYQELF